MQRTDQKVLAIVAVAGMAGAAWGQLRFAEQGSFNSRSDFFELSHLIELSDGTTDLGVLLPSGNVETTATFSGEKIFQFDVFQCMSGPICGIVPDAPLMIPMGAETVDFPTDVAFENVNVGVTGDCVVGYYSGIRAEAEAETLIGIDSLSQGYGHVSQFVARGAGEMCWQEEFRAGGPQECCYHRKTVDDEYGFADVAGEFDYDLVLPSLDPITATVTHTVSYESQMISTNRILDPVCPIEVVCDGDKQFQDFVFCMSITTRFHTPGGIVEEVLEGAVFILDNGDVILPLGFMDDPGFSPFSGDTSFDFETELIGVVSKVEVDESIKSGPASMFVNGDVDDDGDICGSDRAALIAAIGSSFGDPSYNLRADLDLDGDVDVDDLALLNMNGCTADLDCDGSLTIFDQQSFSNAFSAMDPIADWNGDGSFDTFDFLAFNNTFDLGCP